MKKSSPVNLTILGSLSSKEYMFWIEHFMLKIYDILVD
jgi:hypothetical protein